MTAILSPYQQRSPGSLSSSTSRRTNSLGFAKSDCHSCSSLGLSCDRQRPRCTTCQNSNRLCPGYSMQLTWQRSHSAANKPPKVKTVSLQSGRDKRKHGAEDGGAPNAASRTPKSPANCQKQFTFVPSRPVKRRKRRRVEEQRIQQGTPLSMDVAPNSSEPQPQTSPGMWNLSLSAHSPPSPLLVLSPEGQMPVQESWTSPGFCAFPPTLDTASEIHGTATDHPDAESLEKCFEIQQYNDSPGSWSQSTPESVAYSWSDAGCRSEHEYRYRLNLSSIPQMCFANLHDKFAGLLSMYDEEFCKYPVTNDFSVNPYRYRPETTKGSRHLLHAVLAIASHFVLRSPNQPTPPPDALVHKNTATNLYQGALGATDLYATGLALLETKLAIWQLEATISALNIWRSHLTETYQLLEFCGGSKKWSLSRRANVQVSMVLWWDTIISLLARQECILPYEYLEVVLRSEGRQSWTFYELNGCPRELFVPMTQLANLSALSESKPVLRLVAEIEQSIQEYEYPGQGLSSDSTADDDEAEEEAMHTERDRYHCCEGFRFALLIYILRIFPHRRKPNASRQTVQGRISFLARVCLDHVAACRSTALIQKQLLFPVLIAGAETRSIALREFSEEFCRRWFRKFGYQMFTTVLDVLQAVWNQHDAGNEAFWWGNELDARRAREGEFVQFCFG